MTDPSFDLQKLIDFRRHLLGVLRVVESQIAVEQARQAEKLQAKIFVRIGVSA
jgi:hypothetical protein